MPRVTVLAGDRPDSRRSTAVRGTQWRNIPNMLQIGVARRGSDNPKGKSGRQMIHGCPYLPGGQHIQLGIRADAEVLILISLKNLICGSIPVWRSANDIIFTSGVE
eukprot:7230206-Pyramimonas_sp.AAC.1